MDAENLRLQTELEHAKWEVDALLQERDQWKQKFQRAQQELSEINGNGARNGREINLLKEENNNFKEEVAIQKRTIRNATATISRLEEELKLEKLESNQIYASYRDALLMADKVAGPTYDEFERLQAKLDFVQEKNAILKAVSHPNESCQEYSTRAWQKVQDAEELQAAAEAEVEALRYLQIQNEELQRQHEEDTKTVAELVQTNMQLLAKVTKSSEQTNVNADEVMVHELRQSLESELGDDHSYPSSLHSSNFPPLSSQATPPIFYGHTKPEVISDILRSDTVSLIANLPFQAMSNENAPATLSLSGVQALVSVTPLSPPVVASSLSKGISHSQQVTNDEPALVMPTTNLGLSNPGVISSAPDQPDQPETPPPDTVVEIMPAIQETSMDGSKPNVALTIHIKPHDRKAWALLSRVQSAISKTSTLDVQGPADHVNAFTKQLKKAEADHGKLSATATHWQKIALDELAQNRDLRIDLYNRPQCVDAEHRHLKDELEAKESQLRMQESLLADWRRRHDF
ncbi:hypothetical protein J1614_001399 [Plenodomus biglobosus]|nr:hypothetical protein J1614_001399 [Plenodomus biglobosus]